MTLRGWRSSMTKRQHQAAIRRAKRDLVPVGKCDLCSKEWVFVWLDKAKACIKRRCAGCRNEP